MKLSQANFNPIQSPVESSIPSSVLGIEKLVSSVIGFITVIGGVLFLLMFIIGSYNWITAAGKPDKLEEARNRINQSVIGLLILVGSVVIVTLIGFLLGIDLLDLSGALSKISSSP